MIQVQKIRYVFRDCVAFGEKGTACPHHDCRITLNLQETLRTDLVKGTECRGTAKQGSVMFFKVHHHPSNSKRMSPKAH